jgi:protein-disulfide isomerase
MGLSDRIKYAQMRARHPKLLKPWYRRWWGISLIILSLALLAFLFFSSAYIIIKAEEILSSKQAADNFSSQEEYLATVNGDGSNYYLGKNDSEIVLVEFGDFACPYCKESVPAVKELNEKYGEHIKIIWRDYLRNEDSIPLAVSGRCAGDQGKFWEMHDLLFENQEKIASSSTEIEKNTLLENLATSLGLDKQKFSTCLSNHDHIDAIKKDYSDANEIQIAGTPAWFVNGYAFAGAATAEQFDDLISGLIKKSYSK